MSELILQGPFLTRAQAARQAGVPGALLMHRPDLLRVGGPWLQEAYFAFQFDADGVRPSVGAVVQALKGTAPDVEIADWLVCSNRLLGHASPLGYLKRDGSVDRVLVVAEKDGVGGSAAPSPEVTAPESAEAGVAAPVRRRPRPRHHRRLALHGR